MKLKYKKCLEALQKLTEIEYSHKGISKLLGGSPSANALSNRLSNDGYLSEEEVKKIEEVLAVDLTSGFANDCVEIEHIHINPSCGNGTCVLETAEITPIKLGKEIIKDIWGVADPSNLKLFKASGDSMENTIEDGNLLLVDISRIDFQNGGIFLLTINNDWFVKRLRKRMTGELDIISDNPKYPCETLLLETFKEVSIKGRVIKNLSKGL